MCGDAGSHSDDSCRMKTRAFVGMRFTTVAAATCASSSPHDCFTVTTDPHGPGISSGRIVIAHTLAGWLILRSRNSPTQPGSLPPMSRGIVCLLALAVLACEDSSKQPAAEQPPLEVRTRPPIKPEQAVVDVFMPVRTRAGRCRARPPDEASTSPGPRCSRIETCGPPYGTAGPSPADAPWS